ncbi:hypothetical protein AB0C51_14630 [Streptomyces pathocidini]|uniref:hypothetical protein n=1 Tax=Streptomyces pathocidini TaxID=1650571 RepID=UPI0033EAA3E6
MSSPSGRATPFGPDLACLVGLLEVGEPDPRIGCARLLGPRAGVMRDGAVLIKTGAGSWGRAREDAKTLFVRRVVSKPVPDIGTGP